MFLSWLTIGVLILEVFWAGRLWQRTVSPARTEDPVAATPMLQDLLSGLRDWEEETWTSLEDLGEELGGALEERDSGGEGSERARPLPPTVRGLLQTLPGQVAALLAREVWQLPLAKIPAHLSAFQGGGSFGGEGPAAPHWVGGAEQRAVDREFSMRAALRRLQRAREILLRHEAREVPRPPESLDVTLGDPLHDVPLGILALAIIAANATSSLRQVREEIQEWLRAGEEQRESA